MCLLTSMIRVNNDIAIFSKGMQANGCEDRQSSDSARYLYRDCRSVWPFNSSAVGLVNNVTSKEYHRLWPGPVSLSSRSRI
jgi:hypothetical protein